MARTNNVILTLVFEDATTRTVTFRGVDNSALNQVKPKIKALNTNMPEAFATTFISTSGTNCTMIGKAQIVSIDEEVIYNAS